MLVSCVDPATLSTSGEDGEGGDAEPADSAWLEDTGSSEQGEDEADSADSADTGGAAGEDPLSCDTCLIAFEDLRDRQDAARNAIKWTLDCGQGASSPHEAVLTWSWYDGARELKSRRPHVVQGLVPLLPYDTGTELQDSWKQASGEDELELEAQLKLSWDGLTCSADARFPFSQPTSADNIQRPSKIQLEEGALSDEQLATLFDDVIALRVIDAAGQGSLQTLTELHLEDPFTGDLLLALSLNGEALVEAAGGDYDINQTNIASAAIRDGMVYILTEGGAGVSHGYVCRYDLLEDDELVCGSLEEFQQRHDAMPHHDMFIVPDEGGSDMLRFATLNWSFEDGGAGDGGSMSFAVDPEDLSAPEAPVSWFDATYAVDPASYSYVNSTTLGVADYHGNRHRSDVYPVEHGSEANDDYESGEYTKPLIVSGDVTQDAPQFVFVRDGFEHEALSSEFESHYPEARVVGLPELADGRPPMSFPHSAKFAAVDEDSYVLDLLNLGRESQGTSFLASFEVKVPEEEGASTAVLICSREFQQDATSHSSVVRLPLVHDPETSLIGVMLGCRVGDVYWLSNQCEYVAAQLVEDRTALDSFANHKWYVVESVEAFVRQEGQMSMSSSYDFEALRGHLMGLDRSL